MINTTSDVKDFFNAHWTVRKYKNVKMPQEHLEVILDAAQRAPTDATAQMYSFIRLTDENLRRKIATLSSNPHIETASEAFIVCADINRLENILKLHSFIPGNFPHIAIHFALGDAVLAGQNMLIAAELLGYRGCWIGGLISAPAEISELVRLPVGVFPYAALTIGVPDEAAQHRPRLPQKLVVHENSYKIPSSEELQKGIDAMGPITQRGNWPETLARYFAKEGGMEIRELKMSQFLKKTIFRD